MRKKYTSQDHEDMQQDVLIYLIEKKHEYDSTKCSRFTAWLWIKVRHAIIDIMRVKTHCRQPRTAELWKKVNCPWPIFEARELIAEQEQDHYPELASEYLKNMCDDNIRSYAVLRSKGVKYDTARNASGIRRIDQLEFNKLVKA